jgi:hypothetical protein
MKPALKTGPILFDAQRRQLHPTITAGVTPHQRNPLDSPHPSAPIVLYAHDQQQETVKTTGVSERLLHPGSHASVTPSLVAGLATAWSDPIQETTFI